MVVSVEVIRNLSLLVEPLLIEKALPFTPEIPAFHSGVRVFCLAKDTTGALLPLTKIP